MTSPTTIPVTAGRLGYRCLGEGPDVVFVHGWPLHREIWRDVAAALPGYRCHLIDLPGSGESVIDNEDALNLDVFPTVLLEAIDHLSLQRYALVANDSGGMTARRCAAARPNQVSALVLTGTEIPGERSWLLRTFIAIGKLPFAAAALRLNLGNRLLRSSPLVLGGAFADKASIGGDFEQLFLQPLLTDRALMDRQVTLLRSYRWDSVDQLANVHRQITAPTLLLWGSRDPFFPAADAERMGAQFGGSVEFDTIESGRLFAFAEFPDRFAARCDEFLSQHHARSEVE